LRSFCIDRRLRLVLHVLVDVHPPICYISVPAPFDPVHYVFFGLSPDHVNQCATICLLHTFGRPKCPPVLTFPPVNFELCLASLPGVLYETPAHPSGIESIFARRMVLASGFRGSSLRFSLSGLVWRFVAGGCFRTSLEELII